MKNYILFFKIILMGSCEYRIIIKSYYISGQETVVVAQLVRAPDCGSGGRRFETDLPPI